MAWFACATRRAISNNIGGTLSPNLGLVLHHQAGNGSLYGWFNNPAAKVSAQFWVGKNGTIEQYIDTARVAWHGMNLNSRYVGVETEGCPGGRDEPMTGAMEAALVRLYAEGARVHGWANALANSDGQRGFGFHRMAVATQCPCQVRLDKRSAILRAAFSGQAPPSTAPPSGGTGGTTAPPFRATPYIDQRTNNRHADVRPWQQRMAQRGWRIGVDGVYGPESERVCRSFQQDKRLGVDGKVGPQTWSATWTAPIT